jgi:hypothetical protein
LSPKDFKMIDERYAAGFLDGEGCIRASRNIRVIVAGCFKPEILRSFQSRWGGNISLYKGRKANCRDGMRWEVTGLKAAEFLNDVLPHLIEKREQAVLAIQYDSMRRSINCRGGVGHSAENKLAFLAIEKSLRELKRVQHCA